MKINTVHSTYHLNHLRCHILPTPDFLRHFFGMILISPSSLLAEMSDVNSDYSACESAYSDGSYASCTFEADWDDDNDKRKRRLATPAFLGFFLEGWGIIMT